MPTPLHELLPIASSSIQPELWQEFWGEAPLRTHANEWSVAGLPAIGAGIDMISHAVATTMVSAHVFNASDQRVSKPSVLDQPMPPGLMGRYEFFDQVVRSLLLRGNFFAVKHGVDANGYPEHLVPVHPDVVSIDAKEGKLIYVINGINYDWDDIFHVRRKAAPGALYGYGVIAQYRSELEGQLYQAEFMKNGFKNAGVPSIAITVDRENLTSEELEEMQTRWMERHASSQRKPAFIPAKGMSIQSLGWTPEDAEWVAGRQLSIAECALMLGLRPEDLGAAIGGNALTYGNRSDDDEGRIQRSYAPHISIIEEAFTHIMPSGLHVRANYEALNRATQEQRFARYKEGIEMGIYTIAEVREWENLPPLPEKESKPLDSDLEATDEQFEVAA